MNDKRTDKVFAILRIEAVLDSRSKLVDRQNGLFFIDSGNVLKSEELTKAYDKLEESYADIIIAEAKYLESLKEDSRNEQKKSTHIKVSDADLEHLREQSTKAILSKEPVRTIPEYGHRVPKEIDVNLNVNLDKNTDVKESSKESKEDKFLKGYEYRLEDLTAEEIFEKFKEHPELCIEKLKRL